MLYTFQIDTYLNMANKKKYDSPKRIPVTMEQELYDEVENYCFAYGQSVNTFVNDAIRQKLSDIELNLKLKK